MGKFVQNENIYVLTKIIEVDPDESTRYRVKSALGNFYVREDVDTLRSNPAEVFTAGELYAILIDVANMNPTDVQLCFGDGINNVEGVLKAGFTIDEIRDLYREWQYGNTVTVGDMVYYTSDPGNTITCVVVDIIEGEEAGTATDNKYIIYDDQNNKFIADVTREQITSAHSRAYAVLDALKELDDAAEAAREDIG